MTDWLRPNTQKDEANSRLENFIFFTENLGFVQCGYPLNGRKVYGVGMPQSWSSPLRRMNKVGLKIKKLP